MMSLNPYEAPEDVGASDGLLDHPTSSLNLDVPYEYASQERTVRWLIRLFVVYGVGVGILTTIELLGATTGWPNSFWVTVGETMYPPFWVVYNIVAYGQIPVYLASAYLYGDWIRRANRNSRALGAAGMSFTPGWCFGWFFVPFFNLIRPYQAVRELYQTASPSAGATDWNRLPASLVGWWWAAWLTANFGSRIEARLFRVATDSEFVNELELWFGVATGCLWLVTTYLVARVVLAITERHEEKRRRLLGGAPALE